MITETRTYTIPLRDAYREKPPHQKAPRALKAVKSFLSKHMKADKDSVKVSSSVNQIIWANGARNPPAKVTVIADPVDTEIHAYTEDEYAEQPDESNIEDNEADQEDDLTGEDAAESNDTPSEAPVDGDSTDEETNEEES
jgi:ribosomal protein L31E